MSVLTRNHFALFGLPEQFAIDAPALDEAYRRVQRTVHPDRFAGATDAERRVAMQLAAQANEAYRTLRSSTARAAYLCALHGTDPAEQTGIAMAADFLTQQMEWRERLEEAVDARSAGALAALRTELEAARAALLASLRDLIDLQHSWADAADSVRRLMFVDRFADEVDDVEHRLTHA
jgi:molecular chaperone HscB